MNIQPLEQRAWWPELVASKDDLSLRELGDRFGTSASAIMVALRRAGISRAAAPPGPRKNRKTQKETRTRGTGSAVEAYAEMIGVVSDSRVAALAGVTTSAVTKWRMHRGIPASTKGGAQSVQAQVEAVVEPEVVTRTRAKAQALVPVVRSVVTKKPAPRVQVATFAWLATRDGGETGYVIGADIAEAGHAAERAGGVVRIERVAVVLG